MNKREVVKLTIEHGTPPYVPWDIAFTGAGARNLQEHIGWDDVDRQSGNHFLYVGSKLNAVVPIGCGRLKDRFGVVWEKGGEGEQALVLEPPLTDPKLSALGIPDADDASLYEHIPEELAAHPDRFHIFALGYTLFERAWALRGAENIMMDLVLHPDFVHELLDRLMEISLKQIDHAVEFGFDCVHVGDDWGHQQGLMMSPKHWQAFIKPRLQRLFDRAKQAGKYLSIHSCGNITRLLDDLEEMGLDIVNPFQPEAMDVFEILKAYRKRLAFHGGLSMQQILPHGTPEEVRDATRKLLEAGKEGGYVFAPGHGVDGAVPGINAAAMLDVLHAQPGWQELHAAET